jgi:DNA modification methylase
MVKPYYEDSAVTIYHGDCREFVDIIRPNWTITDPPYNLGFKSQRYGKGYDSSVDTLTNEDYIELLKKAVRGGAILTCGKQNLKMWLENFDVHEIGVWIAKNKMSGGRVSDLSLWEPVLFLGKNFDRHARPTDVYEFNTSFQAEADGHPCPKPLDLFLEIVNRYTKQSDTILDPFCGSGTTLRAAKDLGRKAIGIELSEAYAEIAAKRMTQEVFSFT